MKGKLKAEITIGGQDFYNKIPQSHIVIGTAGKLINLIEHADRHKPFFDLHKVKFFVADEADELLKEQKKSRFKGDRRRKRGSD